MIALWMPFEAFVEIATQPNGTNREVFEQQRSATSRSSR